jgi:hypothetical protein
MIWYPSGLPNHFISWSNIEYDWPTNLNCPENLNFKPTGPLDLGFRWPTQTFAGAPVCHVCGPPNCLALVALCDHNFVWPMCACDKLPSFRGYWGGGSLVLPFPSLNNFILRLSFISLDRPTSCPLRAGLKQNFNKLCTSVIFFERGWNAFFVLSVGGGGELTSSIADLIRTSSAKLD